VTKVYTGSKWRWERKAKGWDLAFRNARVRSDIDDITINRIDCNHHVLRPVGTGLLTYKWSINGAAIKDGQGTDTLTVKRTNPEKHTYDIVLECNGVTVTASYYFTKSTGGLVPGIHLLPDGSLVPRAPGCEDAVIDANIIHHAR